MSQHNLQALARAGREDFDHGLFRCGLIGPARCQPEADSPGWPDYRWLFVLRGQAQISMVGNRNLTLDPGQLFVRYPGQAHHLHRVQDDRWLEFFILLDLGSFEHLRALGLIDPVRRLYHPGLDPRLLSHIARLCQASPPLEPAASLAALASLFQLLYQADRHQHDHRLQHAQTALRGPKTVAQIAAELDLSADGFRLWFKRHLGSTPSRWRIRQRLDQARILLMDPQQSVVSVAQHLGYPDAFSFSKQFKRHTGLSPSAYRGH